MSDEFDPVYAASDPDVLQASAYIDGDLTAAERTAAEASPSVMALVEQMRAARAALAAPLHADPAQRDAALAAALTLFTSPASHASAAAAATTATASARVVELRRRPRVLRGLAAAAVVALVGVGVANLVSSDSDDSVSISDDTFSIKVPSPSLDSRVADAEIAESDPDGGGSAVEQIQGPATVGADGTAAAQSGPGGPVPAELPTRDVGSVTDLQDYVRERTAPQQSSSVPSSTASGGPGLCGFDSSELVGQVTYLGTPAIVVIDGGDILAVDRATCAELVRAEAP